MPKKTLKEKLKESKVKIKAWKADPKILLCDNIPMPMHGVAPRNKMGGPWWEKTRKEAYKSTGFCCAACGVHKSVAKFRQWLEGHEVYEVDYKKGTITYLKTVPLCHLCHNYIHDGRLRALLAKCKITHKKFTAIIQHGDQVLSSAGLKRKSYEDREMDVTSKILNNKTASWSKWRLIVDGKKYPPKFKSEYALRKAFE